MSSQPTEDEIRKRTDEIRLKRMEQLLGSWKMMQERFRDLEGTAYLHPALAAEVVENYLRDRESLIHRNNIRGRIQRHKVAGLMAASIVKVRPIQLRDDMGRAARVSKDNEYLAVAHGLAVCAEGQLDKARELISLPLFGTWCGDFIYELHRNPDCAPWCSMVFETISLVYFPKNLERMSAKS
jgi:hypothetical protein